MNEENGNGGERNEEKKTELSAAFELYRMKSGGD
jgi:hypothetical protein